MSEHSGDLLTNERLEHWCGGSWCGWCCWTSARPGLRLQQVLQLREQSALPEAR
jgi:hypothetical protein